MCRTLPPTQSGIKDTLRRLGIINQRRGCRAGTRKQCAHYTQVPYFPEKRPIILASVTLDSGKLKDETSPVRCLLLNARSVCNKTTAISEQVLEEDVDMALLTETRVRPEDTAIINELAPPGYSLPCSGRAVKKGGDLGVTGVLSRETDENIHNLRTSPDSTQQGSRRVHCAAIPLAVNIKSYSLGGVRGFCG